MKIIEAILVKRIEFKNKEAKDRYLQSLLIAGKSFYCLEDGKHEDDNGNIIYNILVAESCGYPLIKYIKSL